MTEGSGDATQQKPAIPPGEWWTKIITAVQTPLGFFSLALLSFVVAVPFLVTSGLFSKDTALIILICLPIGVVLCFMVVLIGWPDRLYGPTSGGQTPSSAAVAPETFGKLPPPGGPKQADRWGEIYGAEKGPPDVDTWYKRLRPTLHQASFYTVPTYYLDTDLNVLDYNIAFDIVFRKVAGQFRGRHVNWFIAKLANRDQVHEHGREFTDRVNTTGSFPFVDLEPIVYESADFGRVEFTKVASQLHDAAGILQGWSVALMIRSIDWPAFEAKLAHRLFQDKLWSVYSAPYDRILPRFPPYRKLIADVSAVVTGSRCRVADLGAGTGIVTMELLKQGHRVTAVENNIGMLDRLAGKAQGEAAVSILKGSVENIECLKDAVFDAVVMVNVLYAVDNPLQCLKEVRRLLKPGGVLGFSTTHRGTNLDELLDAIRQHLKDTNVYNLLRGDYDILYRVNRDLERELVKRHEREDYKRWVEAAGFQITRYVESTYHGAVMLVHAKVP